MSNEPQQTTAAKHIKNNPPVSKGDAPYKSIVVVINPASGQDRPILGPMNRAFHAAGVDWDVKITKKDGDALRFAQEAVASGVEAIGVYGGDGTVMEVAGALVGTGKPLAIFPGGTANVMSVELGIPGDLAEAMALVCGQESYVRKVDIGKAGDKYFLLRCGIGFEADMMENADRESKDKLGKLAYVLSFFQTIPKRTFSTFRMTLDGEQIEAEGVTLMVANSANVGLPGMSLSKSIAVDDGLLDVVLIRDTDIGSLLQVAASAVGAGEPLQHWQARSVVVESDPPQHIIRDGEPMGTTPLRAEIVPEALHIVVPRAAVESDEAAQAQHAGENG